MSPSNFRLVLNTLLISALVVGVYISLFRSPKSRFRLREADRPKRPPSKESFKTTTRTTSEPLRLEGIVIDAPAHEILRVSRNASVSEIKQAYKKLMKRYHPDSIAQPGTPQWNEAQKIAAAINRAKEEMIRALKS